MRDLIGKGWLWLAIAALWSAVLAPTDVGATGERLVATPRIELATSILRPGARGSFDVASNGLGVCELSFHGPAGESLGPFRIGSSGAHLHWTWRVARGAADGVWVATVACAHSRSTLGRHATRVKEDFLVEGAGHGHSLLFSPRNLRVRVSKTPPAGSASPTGGRVIGVGGGSNPFPYGQCTYHAYETRPDIFEYAVAHGVPRGGLASNVTYGGYPDYWWNAWRWLGNAQKVGLPTGTVPVPHALVVFPRGYGGSPVGHVAYVETVNADGSYYVSERNWNENPNVTRRLVYAGVPGVGFVYGGPAGQVPVPAPPPPPKAEAPPKAEGQPKAETEANRAAITSYNRIAPGAPYHGTFEFAWERFVAQSNTLTQLGATVGNVNYPAGQPVGLAMTIRLCSDQPSGSGVCNVLGQTAPEVVNFGATIGDLGNVSVTPGAAYYIEYFPPQPYGNGWVTYWWGGGSSISTSNEMQVLVRGFNS